MLYRITITAEDRQNGIQYYEQPEAPPITRFDFNYGQYTYFCRIAFQMMFSWIHCQHKKAFDENDVRYTFIGVEIIRSKYPEYYVIDFLEHPNAWMGILLSSAQEKETSMSDVIRLCNQEARDAIGMKPSYWEKLLHRE